MDKESPGRYQKLKGDVTETGTKFVLEEKKMFTEIR